MAAGGTGAGAAQPVVTAPGTYPGGFGLPTYPPARVDASAQREKQAFLNQPGDVTGTSDDLQATLRDPSSPYLVMAGTAIPAVMVGGINSDLPGMVIGQVAENVYDTATGRFLLIPQGSRLIGSYDNMVSNGQTRVGVIWNRVIFPDTESIDLGSMEGADQGGYAGFHDQVNTHFWSKIGNALLISIAGAGVQLSQPQARSTDTTAPSRSLLLRSVSSSASWDRNTRAPAYPSRTRSKFGLAIVSWSWSTRTCTCGPTWITARPAEPFRSSLGRWCNSHPLSSDLCLVSRRFGSGRSGRRPDSRYELCRELHLRAPIG